MKTLIRFDTHEKQAFYLIETAKSQWLVRQGEQPVHRPLFERRPLSTDVAAVLVAARQTKRTTETCDIIKELLGLEGLKQEAVYYDCLEKRPHETSTTGILLCPNKNDAGVKIRWPADSQAIVASKYQLYSPTAQPLIVEVKKEINKLDQA